MTFGEKAMLTVGLFTAAASWLALPGFRPAFDRTHRTVAALVLALFAAVGASFAIAMFEPERLPPVTDTRGTSDTAATFAPPNPAPTTVYQAPPEPTVTATSPPMTMTTTVAAPPPAPALPPRRDERELKAAAIERQRREALAFMHASRWPQAAEAWRSYIAAYGGFDRAADHAAYYNLGVAYDALRRWSDAADAFERARASDDGRSDTQTRIHLGRCYGKLGRWKESLAAYDDALQIQPSNAAAQKGREWAADGATRAPNR